MTTTTKALQSVVDGGNFIQVHDGNSRAIVELCRVESKSDQAQDNDSTVCIIAGLPVRRIVVDLSSYDTTSPLISSFYRSVPIPFTPCCCINYF